VKTVTEEIGLTKALSYLEHNKNFDYESAGTNRPVSHRIINNYALDMLAGRWQHHHQGIGFDTDGNLIDGQQRLMALVQAATDGALDGDTKVEPQPKLKVKFQVTYGLEPQVFTVVDRVRVRSNDQILAMAGYHNSITIAAVARILYLYLHYDYRLWRRVRVTPEDILNLIKETNLEEYMPMGAKLKVAGIIPSAAIVAYYICHKAFPDGPHEEFIEGLVSGVGLYSDDPRWALRNFLTKSIRHKHRRNSYTHIAVYIKAWNEYVMGARRTVISFRKNERLPIPVSSK
jgi:hypothetical protein